MKQQEVYLVLARYAMDDAPVLAGSLEECCAFASLKRGRHEWEQLHEVAEQVLHTEIGSRCMALTIIRMLPGPVTEIASFGGQV